MANIFELKKDKIFTLDETSKILPFIYKITEESSIEVKRLVNQLEAYPEKNSEHGLELEKQINQIIDMWQNKLEKIGAKPKGLWIVDFDTGSGYYCWKFPETQVKFFHGYHEGFSCRKNLIKEPVLNPAQI